jgi:hypothetical protein
MASRMPLNDACLARLLRACETGYGCRPAISPEWLDYLRHHKLWREAAEAILRLDSVHPLARDCFVETWVLTSFGYHLDEDLLIPFLRKVMPPYRGYDTLLFRGQGRGRVGVSWTPSPGVALRFALAGFDRQKKVKDYRADAVILRAVVPAASIISAPALHGVGEECIIDPSGVEFTIEPASPEVADRIVRDDSEAPYLRPRTRTEACVFL